jgi:hypothetical protein
VRTGVDVETSGSAAVRATVPASAAVQSRVLPACLGLLIAAIGNVLADVATFMAARLAGGARGCDVDLDTGGRGAVLFAMVLAYPSAHIVLGGLAAGRVEMPRSSIVWVSRCPGNEPVMDPDRTCLAAVPGGGVAPLCR